MDLKTFYSLYNIEELDVLSIYNDNNKLYILLGLNANMELIANGYRPEIDLYYKHMFVFSNYNGVDINITIDIKISDYSYTDDVLSFKINDEFILLRDSKIEVIMNYDR